MNSRLLALFIAMLAMTLNVSAGELNLDGAVRERLDAWELNRLNAADKEFESAETILARSRTPPREAFRASSAAYQLFVEEFPRSPAVAYALYRQARALHLDNKRDTARQIYQDIVEFFPDHARFAAASIYYRGLSFQQSGDNEDAVRTWSAIARTPAYRTEPIAAQALLELGRYLFSVNRHDEGVQHLSDLARNFRTTNPDAARTAIDLVTGDHVRRTRNEQALREFYLLVRGFGRDPIRDFAIREADQLRDDRDFWRTTIDLVQRHGRFEDRDRALAETYWREWLAKMPDRWNDWDVYRLARIDWQLTIDGDRPAWVKATRAQYDSNKGSGGNNRVRDFMQRLNAHPDQLREIFRDLVWAGMSGQEVTATIQFLFDRVNSAELGGLAVSRIPMESLDDPSRSRLAIYLAGRKVGEAAALAQRLVDQVNQPELKLYTQLQVLLALGEAPIERILSLCDELTKTTEYAKEAYRIKADTLKKARRYDEAIAAFRAWGNSPDLHYEIADCLRLAGDVTRAVAELEMVEQSFKAPHPPRAALLQARYWDGAKEARKRDTVLVRILRNYRGTSEHSEAHRWRERLGDAYVGANDDGSLP